MTRAAVLAWSIFGLSVVVMVASAVLWAIGADEPFAADLVLYPIAYLAFGAVGALIVSRQPSNRVGRLGLLAGALGAGSGFADTWARLVAPVPGQDWAAWLTTWGFPLSLAPPVLFVLVFPTGRLTSRAWRFVAGLVIVGCATLVLGSAFTRQMADHPDRHNPLGIDWFTGSPLDQGGVGWLIFLAGTVAAALGLVPRLRQAAGVEREQLKWITYAAAVQGAAWVFLALQDPEEASPVAGSLVFLTLALIPVAAGIAILRYRLYDIDLVIRRTLVYGVLVAVLGATYVALVVGLQAVLTPVTRENTAAVAVSTLAIAALFGPVRSRVRAIVDRRFYRSRYDAQQTLSGFGAGLRDRVELESVAGSLTTTATRAVRPASVSLWLRKPSS